LPGTFEEGRQRPREGLAKSASTRADIRSTPALIVATFLASILIAAASPSPTATPVLKQIGRTAHSNAVCGALVVHANGAIDAALRNDVLIGRVIARLRDTDFDDSTLAKRGGLGELNRLAVDLSDSALRGEAEVKRLREAAERKGGPGLSLDLKSFADALGGALGRQRKIGVDLNGFLSFLDYRDMREITRPETSPGPRRGGGSSSAVDPFGVGVMQAPTPAPNTPYAIAGTPKRMAAAAAIDFEARDNDVLNDEAKAAGFSEAAVSGCS
jgi:hypothetical protein